MRHSSLAAYSAHRAGVRASLLALLASGVVRDGAQRIADVFLDGTALDDSPAVNLHARAQQFMSQDAHQSMSESLYQRADVCSIEEHLRCGASAEHPEAGWGLADGSPPSLCNAVRHLSQWGCDAEAKRGRRLRQLLAVFDSLEPISAEARASFSPQHILASVAGPPVHVAAIAAICSAVGMDPELAVDLCLGAVPVGPLQPSGWWDFDPDSDGLPATDIDSLEGHAQPSDIRSRSRGCGWRGPAKAGRRVRRDLQGDR